MKEPINLMRKLIFYVGLSLCWFASAATAQTQAADGTIAINIPQSYYQHPVRLLHPYLDYWLMRGPVLEKVVRAATHANPASAITMCDTAQSANAVLTLEPHLFYNPQSRVFYTEIIASVYTEAAAPLVVLKAEAQQIGDLAVTPDYYVERAYTQTFDQVMQALHNNTTWLAWLAKQQPIQAGALCQSLDNLSASKIYY